jgi:alkanesulfonate monooxygenase SsuD/methylene tetrahydromethanopterin reductase-like flavin-dependent oxidoreductase (luciferase family)
VLCVGDIESKEMTTLMFGVNVSTSAARGADPVKDARRAEDLGFDFVSASDHPCGSRPTNETWTMLSWIAAKTSRIRVASRVLGVPYRSPAMVAKMAEALDRFSDRRLILGMGAGASDDGLRAFGLNVSSPRDKIDGLEEAIRIIRGLWSQPNFSFTGRLYRTEAAELEPKPGRCIPIWLGTFGERGLALTGRLADGWVPSLELASPERVTGMRERVLRGAREAGREAEEIICVYNIEVRVDERADSRAHVVSGPPYLVADRLCSLVKLGFTAMNLIPVGPGEEEQIERLAQEVIPAVRTAM